MKYKIVCNDDLIGESELEFFDSGMNVRSGKFFPSTLYEKVRSIFQLYSRALPNDSTGVVNENILQEYRLKWKELKLSVSSSDGSDIDGNIHIEDFSKEAGDEGYTVIIYPKKWQPNQALKLTVASPPKGEARRAGWVR